VPMPEFSWIEEEVERCQDVILLLGFWQTYDDPYNPEAYWWRFGGHYVTCAGVNSNTSQLGISDPYFDNAEATGQGIVLPPSPPHPPYPHGPGVHNDTWYVSHDTYFVAPSPSPGGIWGLPEYTSDKDPLQFFNFQGQNWGDPVPDGPYEPGLPVFTEIEYAVAVSPIAGNATLEGHVNFTVPLGPAPAPTWIQSFVVKGFAPGNLSNELWSGTATTNNTGVFTMSGLTPGTYDIGIKNCTCLSELETGVVLTAGITQVTFDPIREADCDENDMGNAADRGLLYDGWNSGNIYQGGHLCDLNRDGAITAADRGLLYDHWNTGGAAFGGF